MLIKQSDIFTIVIVATIGILVSFVTVNALLGNPDEQSVTFKTIDVIDSGLAEPDPDIFNSSAINPTIEVFVGDCEDIDRNGKLDQAELAACGQEIVEENAEETEEQTTENATDTEETGSDTGSDTESQSGDQ